MLKQRSRVWSSSWQLVMTQSSNASNQVHHTNTESVGDKVYLFTHMHSGREAEKDIEEHFAKCINALAERKAVLLKEATQKATNISNIHTISFIHSPLCSIFYPFCFYLQSCFLVLIVLYTEKTIEDSRVKLLASIKASKHTLEACSTIYSVSPSTAEVILKVYRSPLTLTFSPILPVCIYLPIISITRAF